MQMRKNGDLVAKEQLRNLATSPSIRRFGADVVAAAAGLPILDAPCGTGRDSAWLSYIGGKVIGADIDLQSFRTKQSDRSLAVFRSAFQRVTLLKLDLLNDAWPFSPGVLGGIVNIHFLHLPLLSRFAASMSTGGYLILETVEARGGNYLQLPAAGIVRKMLDATFQFLVYKEQQAGRLDVDAVTVKLVARKVGGLHDALDKIGRLPVARNCMSSY